MNISMFTDKVEHEVKSVDMDEDISRDFSKPPTRKEYSFWRGIFSLFKW